MSTEVPVWPSGWLRATSHYGAADRSRPPQRLCPAPHRSQPPISWQHGRMPELRGWASFPAELPDFDTDDIPYAPHELFLRWLHDAGEHDLAPHAVTLSTVDARGAPDARTVILKDVDADGFYLAFNANSPKGVHLRDNPQAALTFFWPQRGRQVRLRGHVEPGTREQSGADFRQRPHASRVETLIGHQSEILDDPAELEHAADQAETLLRSDPGETPDGWVRYRFRADSIEFWQARHDRRHVRLRYRHERDAWHTERLWP